MKTQISRIFAIAVVGLFAICASASSASAQSAAKGSFTLPHEVRWQNATLPAGDYTFSLQSVSLTSPMIVTGPNGSVFELAAVIDHSTKGNSVLLLEQRGGTSFVRELDLAEAGLQICYSVPKIPRNGKELAQGPATTEQVLVAMVKK